MIESTIFINNLESAAPGYEGFYARANVVIKTAEHETYRLLHSVNPTINKVDAVTARFLYDDFNI